MQATRLAGRPTLLSLLPRGRRYSGTTRSGRLHASPVELWISYTDPALVRRRLTKLAQQVMAEHVDEAVQLSLQIPRGERVRDGYWFMRFEDESTALHVKQTIDGQPFETSCGTLHGVLQADIGLEAKHVRCMLNIPVQDPDPVAEWLRARFAVHGAVERVQLHRRRCNWDGGMGFILFQTPEDAEQALEALDGTPGPTPGCNMYLDYKVERPLYEVRPTPNDDPYDVAPVPRRVLPEGDM